MKPYSINIKAVNRMNGSIGLMFQISYGASFKALGKTKYQQINKSLRGCRVKESDWDSVRKQIRQTRENKYLASRIYNATECISRAVEHLLSQKNLSKESLDEYLDSNEEWCGIFNLEAKRVSNESTIVDFLDYLLNNNLLQCGENTILSFKVLKSHLTAFNSQQKVNYTFKKFNTIVYDRFTKFLQSTKKDSTVNLMQSKLIQLFNEAKRRGEDMPTNYEGFKKTSFVIDNSEKPLTDEDYEKLTRFDELVNSFKLTDVQLQNSIWAKDLITFCCHTGVRSCDLKHCTKESISIINNTRICTIFPQKTKRTKVKTANIAKFTISDEDLNILEKYNYQLNLDMVDKTLNVRVNKYLKTVAKVVGITSNLTLHRGRTTFCTQMSAKGVPVKVLSLMTGDDEKTLEKFYINLSNKQKDTMLLESLSAITA